MKHERKIIKKKKKKKRLSRQKPHLTLNKSRFKSNVYQWPTIVSDTHTEGIFGGGGKGEGGRVCYFRFILFLFRFCFVLLYFVLVGLV